MGLVSVTQINFGIFQIEELSAEHNLLKEAQQSHQSELSALRSAAADKPRPLISLKDHLQVGLDQRGPVLTRW